MEPQQSDRNTRTIFIRAPILQVNLSADTESYKSCHYVPNVASRIAIHEYHWGKNHHERWKLSIDSWGHWQNASDPLERRNSARMDTRISTIEIRPICSTSHFRAEMVQFYDGVHIPGKSDRANDYQHNFLQIAGRRERNNRRPRRCIELFSVTNSSRTKKHLHLQITIRTTITGQWPLLMRRSRMKQVVDETTRKCKSST